MLKYNVITKNFLVRTLSFFLQKIILEIHLNFLKSLAVHKQERPVRTGRDQAKYNDNRHGKEWALGYFLQGEKEKINWWLGNGTLLISGYILDSVMTLFLVYPFSLLRTEQQRIADIFVKKGPYLKMYSTYIKEFDKNIALLDEQCKKNPGFAAVVREFEVFLLPSSVLLPLSLFWS